MKKFLMAIMAIFMAMAFTTTTTMANAGKAFNIEGETIGRVINGGVMFIYQNLDKTDDDSKKLATNLVLLEAKNNIRKEKAFRDIIADGNIITHVYLQKPATTDKSAIKKVIIIAVDKCN